MMDLSSAIYRVATIKKSTKAKLFADVKAGDLLRFKMSMGDPGRGRGLYASIVTVENLTQGTRDSSKSQTEVSTIIDRCFELVPHTGEKEAVYRD